MKTRRLLSSVLAIALCLGAVSYQTPAQVLAKKNKNQNFSAAAAVSVTGSGTPGRVSRWTGVSGATTYVLGDSNIFEDKFGKVGIGTTTPTSPLTVQGMIEITLGGLKFPDGTVQTTAFNSSQVVRSLNGLTGDVQLAAGANITITPAGNTLTIAAPNVLTAVAHNATLTGDGTSASPLGVVQSNPADQPFQITLNDPLNPSSAFTVPAGKRLVIEYVGGFYSVPTADRQQPVASIDIRTQIGSVTVLHTVLANRVSIDTLFSIYHVGQNVRLYADPGTQVKATGVPFNAGTASVTLSGHFVNVP